MALVLALLPDTVAASRLRRAVNMDAASRSVHRILYVNEWDQAVYCAAVSAPQILVFDPFDPAPAVSDDCAVFHERFSSVALLPYASFDGRTHRQLLSLAALGIKRVVSRDEDDGPLAFRAALESLLTVTVVGEVLRQIQGVVPAHLLPTVRGLVSAAHRPIGPREVAEKIAHIHPNTLREHLRAAGLPPVNKLIVWSRLFHAANLLSDRTRSVENVALTLDYPSSSALRNQFQRYAGMTPQEVRAGGGIVAVTERFLDRRQTGCWEVSGLSTIGAGE
jgi:AraC-like DNA-binding protein